MIQEYYEYDGLYHRLSFCDKTAQLEKAEAYIAGDGFCKVRAFPVRHEGTRMSEKAFKMAVSNLRRARN